MKKGEYGGFPGSWISKADEAKAGRNSINKS